MRRLINLVIVMSLLISAAAVAQVRGKARLQGTVVDQETGKPVDGATVTIAIADGSTQPIVVKSNAKGKWAALGLVGGVWNVDIEAKGYGTSRGSVSISELQMVPPIKTALAPAKVVEQESAPVAPVSSVPDSARNAITQAQDLLAAQVGDMLPSPDPSQPSHTVTAEDVKANGRKAAELIEGALPQIPADTDELRRVHVQIQQVLAQAYYKAGNLPKAIENLERVIAADPSNVGVSLLLVNLYLEAERLNEGKALLEKLPADSVTDPTVYLNVGILFLNKGSVADALTYFDKAVALDATRAENFYYRGLANLQLKKTKEAKADFEKVVAMAPDSSEGRDAKQLIPGLK